jgi:hypothetical protein
MGILNDKLGLVPEPAMEKSIYEHDLGYLLFLPGEELKPIIIVLIDAKKNCFASPFSAVLD